MAKALQCPSCGRKHPVTTLPNTATFPCSGCGQSLKVPTQFRQPVSAPAVARTAAPAAPVSAAPAVARAPGAPRTPVRPPSPPLSPRPSPDGTAVLPVERLDDGPRRRSSGSPRPPAGDVVPDASPPSPLRRLGGIPLLLLAWLVAIGLGGIITVYVARKTGWLSGQRLVDVFTGTGLNRYLRVIAIVPVWALVTTILVTLIVEGSRWLARARQKAHAERAAAVPGD